MDIEMQKRFGITKSGLLIGLVISLAVIVGIVVVLRLDATGSGGSRLSSEFIYDVDKFARIDPALIIYESAGENIPTNLKQATAIALDAGGTVYVAGDKAVSILNGPTIELNDTPSCLTVSQDGKIYVGLKDHIEVYDNNTQKLTSWKSLGSKAVLTSIAVHDDNVFVADAGNRVVVHYDTTGRKIKLIGQRDKERGIDGFVIPSAYFDLAVSRDGLLRVVNPGRRRIEAYTFDGDYEFAWGESSPRIEGFCGCCNPVNIAISENGSFITSEKGLTRIKVYDSDGGFVGVVAGPEQFADDTPWQVCNLPSECAQGGFDVAVDKAGQVFVLDTIKNVIRIFRPKKETDV